MFYAAFLVLAVAVVFLSIKLSKYVDMLDKTTKVSGAFIGGVLLAAVTSLPELFTSVSGVLFLGENSLVTGNILGSNIFNLAALGAVTAVMCRGFRSSKIGKHNVYTLLCCLAIYALIAIDLFVPNVPKLGFISVISPLICTVYVLTLFITPKTEESSENTKTEISVKQLIIRFVIAAVLLVGVSICITYVTDYIADELSLGKTFAGALLLGLTTSLPELVSTISLCRRGNFNASVGNILGSNVFNFFILFLADMLSFRKGNTDIYPYFKDGAAGFQSMLLLILGAIATIFALILITVKIQSKQKALLEQFTAVSAGSMMTASYILFLILSTILV